MSLTWRLVSARMTKEKRTHADMKTSEETSSSLVESASRRSYTVLRCGNEMAHDMRSITRCAALRTPPSWTTYQAIGPRCMLDRETRLNVGEITPSIGEDGRFHAGIFLCGPSRLIAACEHHARELRYPEHPEHLLHIESFNAAARSEVVEPFDVEVVDPDHNGESRVLSVPPDRLCCGCFRTPAST